jgi:hypothetical protein
VGALVSAEGQTAAELIARLRREILAPAPGLVDKLKAEVWRGIESQPRLAAPEPPDDPYGVKSKFGRPSTEETRTWGNKTSLQLQLVATQTVQAQTTQLVHVARRVPCTFSLQTILTLGPQNWSGEAVPTWFFVLAITIGVGQATDVLFRPIAFTSLQNSEQLTDFVQLPAHAIQSYLIVVCNDVANTGLHTIQVSQFAAPVTAL